MEGGQPGPGTPGGAEHGDWVLHVANQLANAELPPRKEPKRRKWIPAAVAGVLVAGAVVAMVVLGGGDDDVATTESTSPPIPTVTTLAALPTEVEPATTTADPTTTAADPATTATATSAAETTAPATTAPATTAPAASTTVPADPDAPPVRWAEYSGGVVYLRGMVPDQATADEVATKAAAVVGEANVRVEYTVDPTAARPDSAPLYVYDSILFQPGEAELDATARGTLDLGVSLLTLYPQITFDIEGHTDDIGSDAENLALSQRRVDVIMTFLTDRGVDAGRLTAVAKGESEPIADNASPEGRAKNRRIEISVNNLLG